MKASIRFNGITCWIFGISWWGYGKSGAIEFDYRCINIHSGPFTIILSPQDSNAA